MTNQMPESAAAVPDMVLVAEILAGDGQAFERMMRQHNRRLFRAARSILRDDAEAEDAVQEGYIRAYQKLADFRGQSRLSTWLTRIIVNQALERKRRRWPAMETSEELENLADGDIGIAPETPESQAMRSQLQRLIEAAIDALPATYRGVFILRAVEGLSVEETAASLGLSEANVKVRFLRARTQLRATLGRQLGPVIENVFAFDGGRCDRIVARVLARLGLSATRPEAGEITLHA